MYYTLKSSTQLTKELNSYLTLDLWKETEEAFKLELDTPGFSKNEIKFTMKNWSKKYNDEVPWLDATLSSSGVWEVSVQKK